MTHDKRPNYKLPDTIDLLAEDRLVEDTEKIRLGLEAFDLAQEYLTTGKLERARHWLTVAAGYHVQNADTLLANVTSIREALDNAQAAISQDDTDTEYEHQAAAVSEVYRALSLLETAHQRAEAVVRKTPGLDEKSLTETRRELEQAVTGLKLRHARDKIHDNHRRPQKPELSSTAQTGEDPLRTPRGSAVLAAASLGRNLPKRVKNGKAEASNWSTFPTKCQVLIAVHTVAAAMRLKDLVGLLDDDPEIGLTYTAVPDRLGDGVDDILQKWRIKRLAWEDAKNNVYDLAIGASLHRLGDLRARRTFAIAHGSGYNKRWPSWAWPGSDESRPTYGLDRESLLDDTRRLVVDALNLSHIDQWETLKRQCPEAITAAMVGGDPSFDRLLVSMPSRQYYRDALGVRDGQTLVAVASTWGQESLLSRHPDLLMRLLTELPANHKIILTAHPAVWFEHGPRRIRTLLREACHAGLDVVDAGEDWQGLLAAADYLVGDHTSVSVYGAASGLPFLLSHFAEDDIDGDSVMAELAELSPQLDDTVPVLQQLAAAAEAQPEQRKVAGERVSSVPRGSAKVLRKKFYQLLELPEPASEPKMERVLAPKLLRNESVSW